MDSEISQVVIAGLPPEPRLEYIDIHFDFSGLMIHSQDPVTVFPKLMGRNELSAMRMRVRIKDFQTHRVKLNWKKYGF